MRADSVPKAGLFSDPHSLRIWRWQTNSFLIRRRKKCPNGMTTIGREGYDSVKPVDDRGIRATEKSAFRVGFRIEQPHPNAPRLRLNECHIQKPFAIWSPETLSFSFKRPCFPSENANEQCTQRKQAKNARFGNGCGEQGKFRKIVIWITAQPCPRSR